MIETLNINPYTQEQRLTYLAMSDEVSRKWLLIFGRPPEDKTFWDTGYWDFFTKLWRADREVKKIEALDYMVGKTKTAASKLLTIAEDAGFVTLRDPQINPDPLKEDEDKRSVYVCLSDDMKQRLDEFFNETLKELEATVESIRAQ